MKKKMKNSKKKKSGTEVYKFTKCNSGSEFESCLYDVYYLGYSVDTIEIF